MLDQKFIARFDRQRGDIKLQIRATLEAGDGYIRYRDLFDILVQNFTESAVDEDPYLYPGLDPERVTEIDNGDYQGTKLFIVGEAGYQPSTYYATHTYYGSCSGCDTLQAILMEMEYDENYEHRVPSDETIESLFSLVLHMFQRMTPIGRQGG